MKTEQGKRAFTKNDVLSMDTETLSRLFLYKRVCISLDDGKALCGFISEMGLSAVINNNPPERLPVSVKINGINVVINNINQIELL